MKWQEEEKQKVEFHRSSNRGLFPGIFHRQSAIPIRDGQDGVLRCPDCTWELEDGNCSACGWFGMSDDGQFSDDFSGSEEERQYPDAPEPFVNRYPQSEVIDRFHDHDPDPLTDDDSFFPGDSDYDNGEEDGSVGSLDGFVVDEDDAPTELETGYFGQGYGLPFASDTNSNDSDTVYTIRSDEDHRSREETESTYSRRANLENIRMAEVRTT